ncbi:MAG: hypothetical protein IH988_05435, partial [Planctomycetes bacterium]|nr:hypothetical protein [Planctomycetota bacterium]
MADQETATDPVASAPDPAPAPEVAPEAAEVDPASVDRVAAEEQEPAPELEAPELDGTEVRPEPETPEPETWEVEKNGIKYRVPIELKDEVMWHADYTTKTQELARGQTSLEQREEVLVQRDQALVQRDQAQRENIQDWGEFAHTEKLLDSFRSMTQDDWNKIREEDPDQYENLRVQRDIIRDQRDVVGQRIQKFESEKQQREHDTRVTAEREHADRRDRLQATLARDIPNYSPTLQGKMNETAIRGGFTQADIDSVTDPKMMQMLHLAHLGEQVLQRQRAAKAQPAPVPVTPVPKASGGGTPTTGPNDKQN